MNLVCYLFDTRAGTSLAVQIARIGKHIPWKRICVVYRDERSIDSFMRKLRKLGIAVTPEFYSYAGTDWEFGAYQLGIDAVARAGDDLIIMNDTAGRHYPLFRSDIARFTRHIEMAKSSSSPSIVGKVESIGNEFSLCDYRFNSWVRSNLFYLNSAAMDVLNRRVFEPTVFRAPVVAGDTFSIGLQASESLRRYLADWMSPNPAMGGWVAHTGRHEVPDALRRDKSGSILLEKLLSARITSHGGRLLNYGPGNGSAFYAARVRVFFMIRRCNQKLGNGVRKTLQRLRAVRH